jgi:CheY-like chemotaxis protein
MKILVVEDMEDSRDYLKFLLELSNYKVIEAANGKEAVEIVKKESPDLILMDISMPVMDGITAVGIIRKFEDSIKLPIIAVTAFGNEYRREAIKAGCNELIAKPIDPETLNIILDKYLT